MPGLEDAMFSKSVIYMCEHSERGALGLVINKPSDINLKKLFEKVELPLHREDLLGAPARVANVLQIGAFAVIGSLVQRHQRQRR